MKNKIFLQEPIINTAEINSVKNTIKSGWISSSGSKIKTFEDEIKKITNSKYVVSCINGSCALLMSVKLIAKKKKGDILIPSLSFVSSVSAIVHNSCNPFFVDSAETFNIDEKKLSFFLKEHTFKKSDKLFNKFTKNQIIGIVVTHMWGNSCNMEEILRICKIYNLPVIEDAAESLGSYVNVNKKYRHTGTLGKIGCLSFNGNKIITTGGGGALLTNDKNIYNTAKLMIDHFKIDNYNYLYSDVGYNFKLNNVSAAIGIAQIKKLKKILIKKKKIFHYYKKKLNKIDGLEFLENPWYSKSNYWMNVITINKKKINVSIDKVIKFMQKNSIETRKVWHLNHLQKPFKKYKTYNIYKAKYLQKNSLCIPSSADLSQKNLKKIIISLKKALS